MTEAEWMGCTEPDRLLNFMEGKVSDRKLRLFACAWVRRIWNVVEDERSRVAVEVAERAADGLATAEELESACTVAHDAAFNGMVAGYAAMATAFPSGAGAAEVTVDPNDNYYDSSVDALYYDWSLAREAEYSSSEQNAWTAQRAAQAALFRELVGNPLRSVRVAPSVLAWNDGTVVKIAERIYDERAFDRLPVLADALEEAGCHDADILGHCRHPGLHVRGCWVVDLLTGRT